MSPDRTTRPRALLPLAAGAVAAAAAVWLGLGMHRGLLLSSDVKSRCWPWAPTYAAAAAELQAPLLSDPVWQFVPWLRLARRELLAGRLPLWNPHQDGGVPLLGNGQSALLSPLTVPVLAFGVAAGGYRSLLLRVVVAGLGTFALLRDRARSHAAAAAGAAAFALSGAFVAWLEHPHTLAAAFAPWLLLFALRLARRATAGAVAGVAGSTYALLAAGHPETALMALLLAAAALVALARSWRGAGRVAAATALGGCLAAPAVLPLAEYLWHSEAIAGAGRTAMTLPWGAALGFMVPAAAAGHPIEGRAYLSVVVALLALAGAVAGRREREARFWCLAAAAACLVVFANPVAGWLAVHTPVYWTRALLLVPLPVAALAADGLDRLAAAAAASPRLRRVAPLLALAPVLVLADLLAAARGVHAVTPSTELERGAPILDRLAADPGVFRVLPLHTFLPPNAATELGLDDLRGYDALAPRAWRAERRAIGRFAEVQPISDAVEPWELAPGGSALDFWNVKYLLVHPQLRWGAERLGRESGLDLATVYAGPDGLLLENRRALPRARLLGAGAVELLARAPARWELAVTAPAAAVLEVANPYFPGWRAHVDGCSAAIDARPGQAVRVRVPAGAHRVELLYRPVSLAVGVLLALLAALALSAWASALPRVTAG